MKTKLLATNYNQFRDVINQACSQKIHRHGDTTFLYNPEDKIVAAMKQPKIDHNGRCLPTSYYVSANIM